MLNKKEQEIVRIENVLGSNDDLEFSASLAQYNDITKEIVNRQWAAAEFGL